MGVFQGTVGAFLEPFWGVVLGAILWAIDAVRRTRSRHAGVELRANLKLISHRCHLFEVAFVLDLTKETIQLPLGCLQGEYAATRSNRGEYL